MLPETNLQDALHIAETIRVSIAKFHLFDRNRPDIRTTVSIGIALTVMDDSWDHDELVEKADVAMLEAKRQGRNSIVVCGSNHDNQMQAMGEA
jgi:diguanylate cyclase (GGDEF)-like protein